MDSSGPVRHHNTLNAKEGKEYHGFEDRQNGSFRTTCKIIQVNQKGGRKWRKSSLTQVVVSR